MTERVSPSFGVRTPRPAGPVVREDAAWRQCFDRAAHEEARLPWGSRYLRSDVAEALKRTIPVDARVLELGCGLGDTLAALPNATRLGIDYTAAAVERARLRNPAITVEEGDALTWQSPERFDAIVCDRLVHSVPDIQQLLENAVDHLAPGGRVFLTCFNYLWELAIRASEQAGLKLPTPPNNWLSESDLENLFTLVGLEVVKFEDRLLLPLPLPGVSSLLNRYVGKLPGLGRANLYRLYVLRRRSESRVTKASPSVSVVVPARNEEGNIANIIARTPKLGGRTELIFVEGGSKDNTRAAIEAAIASYDGPLEISLFQQTGKGKGDAVRVGFGNATGDLLMILDADLTVPPEELPKFYDVMVNGMTDYVHGTRLVYPMEAEAMRFLNKLGNIGFSKLFSYLLNQPLKDTLCGTKVLWAEDYARLAANRHYFGDFDPFGDFDLIFGSAKLNLKILEIPIRYRDRTYGETNISRFRHGWMLLQMSAVAATKLKFI
ncbi:MAG: glycosyltransferase [Myxococcales bacterium]|nr:glycosyltransferase [Myxococcales bacterium]